MKLLLSKEDEVHDCCSIVFLLCIEFIQYIEKNTREQLVSQHSDCHIFQ